MPRMKAGVKKRPSALNRGTVLEQEPQGEPSWRAGNSAWRSADEGGERRASEKMAGGGSLGMAEGGECCME